ncbi:formyltetrahydrofolate-dependent phosphoribosylglycinamide formyltransferase [Spirosoma oryzae]|uniref:Phosphoribosylglycinamide formyltransferase n=1 Tax=Spirosoma oryzae TaxID=1469603 RepID=A0A2T0SH98_9BACT|nr:phosphoribosylglycinamide formyltransferase [Spirosoma oryzae]PRY32791.1 formyltetrahydrofolate-dependent phosphoribosylglycinamide formyltransferase [Spirosoma oryzae]
MKRIAIFASGSGSNAEKIADYFASSTDVSIELIVSNNPKAGVIDRARRLHIPVLLFDRTTFYQTDRITHLLQQQRIDLIVLAGFMWLMPAGLVQAFPDRIVNIHPALLPKFGGKGMYGHFVHEAVVAAQETESGITIHFVNEHYDEGAPIFQAHCPVTPTDTPDDVARKVQALEHDHYPRVVAEVLATLPPRHP